MDTIFAVSSGLPPAAIAVLRISGPDACGAVRKLAGTLPAPRRAGLRALRDSDGSLLDRALVLVFPGPDSATGEDLVELHCHGGRAVIAAVERALASMGLRHAEPGEFTRRALSHGRIDLAQAEGLADLLAAETEGQRLVALNAAEGQVSALVRGWMDRIAAASAAIEATLDFGDEDDVPADPAVLESVGAAMREVASDMDAVLSAPPVERLRDGVRVILAGPPNSGKSTLFNALIGRDAAIVSPIAGTTRDRIEASVSREGIPFVLIDTAGLHDETDDPIEAVGISRAREAMAEADLVLWLGDEAPPVGSVWLHARADLPGREERAPGPTLSVAAQDRHSLDVLWKLLAARAATMLPRADRPALHRQQRNACAAASAMLAEPWRDPLVGAELARSAHRRLGALLGIDATEAMLDALFGRFCIGK